MSRQAKATLLIILLVLAMEVVARGKLVKTGGGGKSSKHGGFLTNLFLDEAKKAAAATGPANKVYENPYESIKKVEACCVYVGEGPLSLNPLSLQHPFNSFISSDMEFFRKAKSVRLISHKDKYLVADDDFVTISQDSTERTTTSSDTIDSRFSAKNAIWTVELVPGKDSAIRLQSCFGTYLTASSQPFLPGVTGRKIVQTMPGPDGPYDNVATEWEPQRDGMQVRLRSFCGHFLRPHGGLPPWRNSITHDMPHRPNTWNKILWDVNVVEKRRCSMETGNEKGSYLGRSRSRSFSGSMSFKLVNFEMSQERI